MVDALLWPYMQDQGQGRAILGCRVVEEYHYSISPALQLGEAPNPDKLAKNPISPPLAGGEAGLLTIPSTFISIISICQLE